jgi:hypothetical protein
MTESGSSPSFELGLRIMERLPTTRLEPSYCLPSMPLRALTHTSKSANVP